MRDGLHGMLCVCVSEGRWECGCVGVDSVSSLVYGLYFSVHIDCVFDWHSEGTA